MNSSNVGHKSKVRFNLENGTFDDGEDYVVEVSAVNIAGLHITDSCSVHVNLFPPDISAATSDLLYTETDHITVDNEEPLWTGSQSQVGITWSKGSNETEFYEWKIGTQEDNGDIFPAVKVGQNTSGSSAIVHGKLEFNRKSVNKTVSEFKNTQNMTMEEIQNQTTSTTDQERAFFYMEPGRCIYQSLYAIGYSHLKSKLRSKTVCIKRKDIDIYIRKTVSSDKTIISKSKGSDKWFNKTVPTPEVVIEPKLTKGGISMGTLTAADKSKDYGSAATADYNPYITDPALTMDKTSRQLRHRITRRCGVSFYLSPAPEVEFEDIVVNVTLPAGCHRDNVTQPALVYWDIDEKYWTHIDEGCMDYLTAQIHDNVYFSKVCSDFALHSNRRKRSDAPTLVNPRAFEMVIINSSFVNNPPRILTAEINLTEDMVYSVKLDTVDIEKDTLDFAITRQAEHLKCNITTHDFIEAVLNCTLEEDYYGTDRITVRITETGDKRPPIEPKLSDEKEITINIAGVPDPTKRYYIDSKGTILTDKRPLLKHSITVEANRTSSVYAGTILLADVDGGEEFKPQPRFSHSLGNATYKVTEIDIRSIPHLKLKYSFKYRTLKAFRVDIDFSPDLNGHMTFDFIASNLFNQFTPSVSLDVYVLANPCMSGHCNHTLYGLKICDNIARAGSFSGYSCTCDPGYEGSWCQIDTNECQYEPCGVLFDCQDQVNAFECTINVPKLIAIILCSILGLVIGGLLVMKVRQCYIRNKQNKIRQSKSSLMHEDIKGIDELRPTSSGSIMLDPCTSGIAPASTSKTPDIWKSLNAFEGKEEETSSGDGVFSFVTTAGMTLPPHHQNIKPKIKSTTSGPAGFKAPPHYKNAKPIFTGATLAGNKLPSIKPVTKFESLAAETSRKLENLLEQESIVSIKSDSSVQSDPFSSDVGASAPNILQVSSDPPSFMTDSSSIRCPSALSLGSVTSASNETQIILSGIQELTDIDV